MARLEEFWKLACEFRYVLRMGLMVVIFLFVLSVMALLLAERGTDAYAISIVNFALVSILGVFVAWMNRVCANRETDYY